MLKSSELSMTIAPAGPIPATDAGSTALGRGQGVAAWRQIADGIEADIARGALAPGQQLPTETRLAARFGVNRHTVRRALAVLASRGLLRTTQGRGTFVEARPLAYPIGPRTRFSEIVSRDGREAAGTLVSAETIAATPETARALAVADGSPVLEILSVHSADGTPVSTSVSWYPLPRFKGLDKAFAGTRSITRALAKYGVDDYRRAQTRIGARHANPQEAARLDLVPGRIVLVIDSVNVDSDGVPIQVARALFAADRVELKIET